MGLFTLRSAVTCLVLLALTTHRVEAQAAPLDLARLLDHGVWLADLNGDSLPDRIRARLVVAPDADGAETAAAANVAARLGFETTETDLGLVVDSGAAPTDGPIIAVGARALAALGVDPAPMQATLAPGEGMIVSLSGQPGLPSGGVGLLGYDASGLMEASAYLSGRYPAVWSVDGEGWAEVATGIADWGTTAHPDADFQLTRIVVSARRPGVTRARIDAAVDDAESRARLLSDAVAAARPPRETSDRDAEADPPASAAGDSTEADTAANEAAGADAADVEASDVFTVRDLHRLDLRVHGADEDSVVSIRPRESWNPRDGDAYRAPPDATFSLTDLYSIEGFYRDTNRDLVPDESRVHLSLASGSPAGPVTDLATRIGLETAGLRLPLARVAGQEDDPSGRGFPVVVGPGHYAAEQLGARGRIPEADAGPGSGYVLLVDGAFGAPGGDDARNGLIVDGADPSGVGAALDWLAGRAPWLWTPGKGEHRLAGIQTEVRRFIQARGAAGQVALALAKLDAWSEERVETGAAPSRIEVELLAERVPVEVDAVVRETLAARFPSADIAVEGWSTGFGVGDTIFVHEWDLPWEVDAARAALERDVYRDIEAGDHVEVELRVSEPPEVRAALTDEIRSALDEAGAASTEVRVLSAYKQGYSWLEDVVLPQLRELEVASIDIGYHDLDESEEVRWQTIAADTRWLQELYPIDAVLARELAISDSVIRFVPTRTDAPTYTVTARDAAGSVLLEDAFSPRYVVRPFFDLFPEYEQIRVTTGWLHARAGERTLVDARVVTDPEAFWDRLQTETYREIVDYVLDTQDGSPSPLNAPFFDEFHIDLRLSEPNHRIGVDEEVISSLEALHEDIYFETLTLFDLIGSRYQTSQPYPGRVLPWIDPTGSGQPGRARLSLTGKERAGAEIVMRVYDADDDTDPDVRRYPLRPLAVEAPRLVGAAFEAGRDELRVLQARVEVPDSVDRTREFATRSSEAAIDRQFMNAELVVSMIRSLATLHDAGLFTEALSWDRVAELVVEVTIEDAPDTARRASLTRSSAPASTVAPRLFAEGWRPDGSPLVQWETPIPPAEHDSLLARLATFDQAEVYYMTDSFLGQPIWAVDLLPTRQGRYRSQAKLNALKPTLFISGRQHANEVSSTSHMLRLAELFVTDSAHTALLRDVNVVLHPMANPDGARLAVDMQEVNPDFMLHAGYLGPLGVDITAGERTDDPIYPESQVRRRLRGTWLPDVYVNMHGYPSHEWVQYFAGYSAWVRSRRGGQRSWWAPRGWFIPGFSIVEDDDEPEYATAQRAVLDTIAAAITGEPEVEAMNQRMYRRYRKYGVQDREAFTEYFHEGMLVNMRLRGAESIGTGLYSTRVTWFGVTTEAPDETARGDWLDLVATAGLAHSSALARYLADGEYALEREVDADAEGVSRKVYRVKPVLPAGSR